MKHIHPQSTAVEYSKFLLIVVGIVLLAVLSANGDYSYLNLGRTIMGWFFVVFAGFKFIGYQMFVAMFPGYDLIAKRSQLYTKAYPFIELGLGVLYLVDVVMIARNVLALMIMGVGLIGVIKHLRSQGQIPCACLGNVIKLPIGTVTLVEDGGMALMAATMLLLA